MAVACRRAGTSPPTTTAPTTAPPTTSSIAGSTSELAAELIDVIDDVPRSVLKPKEADDIVERIDDLVEAASRDARDTDAQLRETAEAIARKVSDEASRDRAEELLIALADVLGVPEATVTRAFEREP